MNPFTTRMCRAGARPVRAGIRSIRRIVERLDPQTIAGNFSNPDLVYAPLNATLARFQSEDRALRPNYTWGVLHGAHMARALGLERVSVIEFGVAGGNGLIALERAAEKTEALLGVAIDVHGFDTGRGLPKPTDYRDLPNLYAQSDYCMDVDKLRAQLRRAQLHLGLVAATVTDFIASRPAPAAFVAFDLDYHSSTVDAFRVFEAHEPLVLPRVHCYFDDIMGFTCSEFNGERLAIDEFNARHSRRKISPIFGLKHFLQPSYGQQQWAESMYLAHFFDHPLYGQEDGLNLSKRGTQLSRIAQGTLVALHPEAWPVDAITSMSCMYDLAALV